MRKIFALLTVLLLVISVSAQTPFVVDNGGILNLTERETLEDSFSQFHTEHGVTVSVVTTKGFAGKTAAEYAADCYKENGYGNDGVLLLVCEDEGQWYLYTSGICSTVISDEDASRIGASLMDDLQSGEYYSAFQSFAEQCAEPAIEVLSNQNAAAQAQRDGQKKFVFYGMAGGLLVGILVVVLLGIIAKPKKPSQRTKPVQTDREEQENKI